MALDILQREIDYVCEIDYCQFVISSPTTTKASLALTSMAIPCRLSIPVIG